MRSTKGPMLWVHATVDGTSNYCSVAMRERETLEEAMGRGVCILLDEEGGGTYATEVWSETMDYWEAEAEPALMDGRIPGVKLIVQGTGINYPRRTRR